MSNPNPAERVESIESPGSSPHCLRSVVAAAPLHPRYPSAELERVAAELSAAGVDNTGAKLDETLGKRYVAFKDPDGIAWEFYMA